ncbi:MAG: hypothetical protein GX075_02085 [Firmicutes bacterium]|nr:hypothetical protein [Bacillota bacterium]
MPDFRRHSNLRMYAEVRSSLMESVDSIKDLAEELRKKFVVVQEEEDQLILEVNPESNETVEIKIAPRRIYFRMNACRDYHQFISALEKNLKIISRRLIPKEIIGFGVQGCYLYPIGSLMEFSQLAFSWTGKYINSHSLMEINDLGVTVFFRESGLKVNLACRIMTPDQVDEYFPGAEPDSISKLNLFINIEIAADKAVKMDSSVTNAIGQAIKEQVHQATHLIEERLGKEIIVDT